MVKVESFDVDASLGFALAVLHGGAIRESCTAAGDNAKLDEPVHELLPETFPGGAIAPRTGIGAVGVYLFGVLGAPTTRH
jgi:hypothetical protein